MSAAIDFLHREISDLKKLINARESGIPSALVVMVRGEAAMTPEGRTAAVQSALAPYGLSTAEEALTAGCIIKLSTQQWISEDERNIPRLNPLSRTQNLNAELLSSANSLAFGPEGPSEAVVCSPTKGMTE